MNAAGPTKRTRGASDPDAHALDPRNSRKAIVRATGRDRDGWFALLDEWGAAGREYREIADWLRGEHDISNWWAQKLIVEYEQARGLRPAGVRPDGTFTVGVTRSVGVPVDQVFDALVDADLRARWLPGVAMHERTSQRGRSARFDWEDGATRVNVTFTAMGDARSQVAVEHEHLPDAQAAEERKTYWRERLAALKGLLES